MMWDGDMTPVIYPDQVHMNLMIMPLYNFEERFLRYGNKERIVVHLDEHPDFLEKLNNLKNFRPAGKWSAKFRDFGFFKKEYWFNKVEFYFENSADATIFRLIIS